MTENNEIPDEISGETEGQETENPDISSVIPELTPQTNPWDDAPEGVYFYEQIYEDGHLGLYSPSAELAYKSGWDIEHNYVPIEETQESDLTGLRYFPKSLCPMKGLEDFKTDLLNKISAYADRYEQNKCDEMYVISSLGFRANADRRSLQNVENLIRLGQETVFKDYDNQFHSVSIQDLETLLMEISANGSNLYNQKFQMQMAVMNFTTLEQIENFEIQFTMMDFT